MTAKGIRAMRDKEAVILDLWSQEGEWAAQVLAQ
jgi:hypothetical protein